MKTIYSWTDAKELSLVPMQTDKGIVFAQELKEPVKLDTGATGLNEVVRGNPGDYLVKTASGFAIASAESLRGSSVLEGDANKESSVQVQQKKVRKGK